MVQGKSQPVVLYEIMDLDDPSVRLAKLNAVADFEVALSLHEAGEFEAAIIRLEKTLSKNPSDSVAEVLLQRARRLSVKN